VQYQISIVQRLIRNTTSLFVSQVSRIFFNTIISLLIARRLGAEGLGKYAVLTAYLQIFQILTVMGAPKLVIREMSRHPQDIRTWFHKILTNQLVGSLAGILLLILVSRVLRHPSDTTVALTVIAFSLVPFAVSSACETIFQASERMELIVIAQIVGRGVQVVGSLWALLTGHGVVALACVILVEFIIIAVIEIVVVCKMGLFRGFRFNILGSLLLFRQSFDFFLLSVSVIIFSKLDILILSQAVGEEATGIYNAAYLVIQVINFISVSYGDAAYPVLSRLYEDNRDTFNLVLSKSLLYGAIFTLFAALTVGFFAESIIETLYRGRDYTLAALLLRIKLPFVLIFMWNSLLSKYLMVSNLQRRSVVVSISKLTTGIIYYLVLTLSFGAIGTAVATVLAGFTGMILNYYFVNKEVFKLDLRSLIIKPLFACLLTLLGIWIMRALPWWGVVLASLILYTTSLCAMRSLTRSDFLLFRHILRIRQI